MLKDLQNHPNEVWVKYSLNKQDPCHKFIIEKQSTSHSVLPAQAAYNTQLSIAQEKLDDIKEIAYKYINRKFC